MRAKEQRFKCYPKLVTFILIVLTCSLSSAYAQCPTVTSSSQTFCDVQSILVGDLQATDNGGGIVWYETATSTTPLPNSASLISGEDYYADDNTGTCGPRARVDIIIYGPPVGSNFQGVCLDDPTLATVASLEATGNDVQWYLSPSGGTPLNDTELLMDDTLYYADQASPDGSCRTSRLTVLVNVGVTPMPMGDTIQNFCSSPEATPTVGDLVASGNNNWYISLFSAFPLPANTPLINGQTYYGTTLDPPCESSARLMVVAILDLGPNAGEDGILDICDNNFGATFDLFTSLGGTPDSGGSWSPALNSGTGVYNPNIDPAGDYTYTVVSGNNCPDESATVTVSIIPESNAGTNGTLDLCSNNGPVDLFLSLGGTPEVGGIWSPALASGTGIFDPALDADGIYTYSITGTAPCPDASATVDVSVTAFNDAGEDGTIDICDNNGTIDLFDSLGGTPDIGGIWSPALNSGTGIFDPLVDSGGIYTYSFTGNAPCPDESSTVTVTVVPLPIAGSDGSLTICSNDFTLVNLFDSLGGTPQVGGTWSPALNSGTGIFNPSIDTAGIYTYTLSGTPPCTDVSAEVNVIIIEEPNAGIDAVVDICDNDGPINLFDTLEGIPEAGGTWTPALASGTNIFDPLVDSDGTYTYTITGTNPCADATATVTISVIPFPNAGLDGAVTVCSTDGTIDLFDSLGGTPEAEGTWTPTLTSGTGLFDPLTDTAGTYTYTTSGTGPCSDDTATVEVSIEIAPDAGMDAVENICNNNGTIDLFNSLGGTPDVGGNWTPALASGTSIFDPLVDADGIYTYTVTGIAPCDDATATVTITISPFQDAGLDGSVTVCNDDGTIDLFDSLGGTPEAGGIWTPTLTSGTGIFDPLVDSAGIYTYTILGTGPCIDDSATVVVSIETAPDAGLDGSLTLCSLNSSADLFNSLGGTPEPGGTWSPALASGTGVFDSSLDLEGVFTYTINSALCGNSTATVTVTVIDANEAGNNGVVELCSNETTVDLFNSLGGTPDAGGTWAPTLTSGTGVFDPALDPAGVYTYTVSNSTTLCPDDSATVIVTILQAPDAGNDGTLNLCDSTNTVDLFNSLAGTPETGGTWTPALTSGTGVFDPNTDLEGVYTYTITNSCGTSFATVTVSLSDTNDAGTDGAIDLCATDATVDLFNSLGGTPDVGGTWTPTLTSGTGIFDPMADAPGIYTYTVSNASTPCPDATAIVTVSILDAPDAGNDGTLNLCDSTNTVDLFNSLAGTPETGGTWTPALSSGTGVFDPNTDPEDVYTYTITNSCGTSSATVTVSLSNTNDAGTDGALDLCATDTIVDLFNSLGGTPDVGGTWTPTLTSGTGIFDPMADAPGIYTYTVSSGTTDCPDATATVNVSFLEAPDAGNDGTLNLCDSTNTADLFNSLAGTPETGGTWTPALTSGTGVFDPNTDPEGVYTYTITNSCGTNSATVTVSLSDTNDAGTDGAIDLCATDATVDLFNSLGGTPDVGGTWTPTLTSGTGIFDPTVDAAGIYTYTVSSGTTDCPDATATVTVSILDAPDAGNDGTLNLCDSTNTVDLFNSLAGTPEIGGTWTPALSSGTGVFDPNTDPEGVYTYTITNSCGTSSATVTVSLSNTNDAGTDGALDLCATDTTVDLFNSLGGTPDVGGTWTPALTSGTGIFDPTVDAAGIYTYTVSSGTTDCPDATATVTVSILDAPDAGNDGTLNLCDSTNTVDLFNSLSGTPETGGTWTPALSSGTGVFDPNTDPEGVYTYTITNSCGTSSATVTVSLSNTNDAGTDGALDLCATDTTVDLFNSLGGTPDVGGTWTPALTSGTGIFDPTVDAAGTYTYTVSSAGSTCPDATAEVAVTFAQTPDAGIDGTLDICSSDSTVDLIDSLGGTPETGGTWSPTLASGTGLFDPTVDTAGTYTYTITNSCGTSSAEVTVSISTANNAGTDGTIELCPTDTSVDLFNSLGGTPDVGGTWTPALTSGTGIFDPAVDAAGTYTYTVSSTGSTCPDATAEVAVTFAQIPDAGTDGTLDICSSDSTVDLIDGLGGTPQTVGTWSPTLASGTGLFDPTVDVAADYTYTINNSCGTSSAIVSVTISVANDAGTDGSIEFCSNDAATDLFDSLGGTPETNGTWTPALTSGTGVFDPSVDAAGTYTYTVSDDTSTCPDAMASVEVTVIAPPNAGIDDTLNICIDDTDPADLFDSLGGSPDITGIWTPALASGTGVFDPTVDVAGDYTYTVSSAECNLTDAAIVTVNIIDLPDATGLTLTDDTICLGGDAIINITGANQLLDGDYTIVYELSDANSSTNTISISVVGGSSSFVVPQNLLPNIGTTRVTLLQIFVTGLACSGDIQDVLPIKIFVEDPATPQIIDNGAEFCIEDNATIDDLTNNIVDLETIIWYDQPVDGNAYDGSDLLQDNEVYYASILTENGCESTTRLEVAINLVECIGTLLIPDGFSPNNDGVNDVFDILFIEELYPNFKVSVYNRYGNILYEGDKDSPQWDGTSKNNNTVLPVGVYFYIIEFNDGETEPLQGRVYLSR
ncbi:gliding motility-associated C-terminal domain-containing protein [Winogradskyella forsetii]|uniref:gliding motility-associated C-terminal domain-containing protein n=1 Tax=Winogradskyella forsetii TaxID=2686077 RepID=UPI0015BE1146|nr:gliding motility-associated C-terminal domain-containing protein [Winogradskyella forsetii]